MSSILTYSKARRRDVKTRCASRSPLHSTMEEDAVRTARPAGEALLLSLGDSFVNPATSKRCRLLELPRELRDQIYSFLVEREKTLLAEHIQESRVWEVHISHYPNEHALLYVTHQISSEYSSFANRLFSTSKLLVSTNALTSDLPSVIKTRRVRYLLSHVPSIVLRAMADSKWWVSYSHAEWPRHFVEQMWPLLSACTSIELISQLVGNYIFIPRDWRQDIYETSSTLRNFFAYKIPSALLHHSSLGNRDVIPSTLVKTLVLEPAPFEPSYGNQNPHVLRGAFRDIMNAGGAEFPETSTWFGNYTQILDPLLCQSRLSPNLLRYRYRAAVYRVVEEMD
jgi:hypothetical protein